MALHETTLEAWLRDGPRLVRERPDITTVSLKDRRPLRRKKGGWLWRPGTGGWSTLTHPAVRYDGKDVLPPAIHSLLPTGIHPDTKEPLPPGMYASDMLAASALSVALITWAKAAELVVFDEAVWP